MTLGYSSGILQSYTSRQCYPPLQVQLQLTAGLLFLLQSRLKALLICVRLASEYRDPPPYHKQIPSSCDMNFRVGTYRIVKCYMSLTALARRHLISAYNIRATLYSHHYLVSVVVQSCNPNYRRKFVPVHVPVQPYRRLEMAKFFSESQIILIATADRTCPSLA